MGKRGSNAVAFLLIDGHDILGVSTQFSDQVEAMIEETTGFSDDWAQQDYIGLKRAEFAQEGFFDDAANSAHVALNEQQGISRILCYGLSGNTLGEGFTAFRGAMQGNYNRIASRGELHKCSSAFQGNGAVDHGIILHPHGTETDATGDTEATPHDNGAATIDGGTLYLQVSALVLGGYDDVEVQLLDSDDDITYSPVGDPITVTARGAYRLAIAGTIEEYTAIAWEFNGSGSGQSVKFMAGLIRS